MVISIIMINNILLMIKRFQILGQIEDTVALNNNKLIERNQDKSFVTM